MSFLWSGDGSAAVLVLAVLFDTLVGELPSRAHPVVWMGTTASWAERLAPTRGAHRQLLFGLGIALVIPGTFAAASALLVAALENTAIGTLSGAVLLGSMFALRALGRAGLEVRDALSARDLVTARTRLRSLCSRDPSQLDEAEVAGAAIESLAENASDSVVAPFLYYALFGLPGAVFYRAVNTLDAMIGYHGRYEYLGRGSARLDDLLNFVPARLTALLLILSGFLLRRDGSRGLAILRRDGDKTESPNAGRPMAAMAGLLGVRLEKAGHYELGDPLEPLNGDRIRDAWRIVHLACGLAALLTLALTEVCRGLLG